MTCCIQAFSCWRMVTIVCLQILHAESTRLHGLHLSLYTQKGTATMQSYCVTVGLLVLHSLHYRYRHHQLIIHQQDHQAYLRSQAQANFEFVSKLRCCGSLSHFSALSFHSRDSPPLHQQFSPLFSLSFSFPLVYSPCLSSPTLVVSSPKSTYVSGVL